MTGGGGSGKTQPPQLEDVIAYCLFKPFTACHLQLMRIGTACICYGCNHGPERIVTWSFVANI